jgi:hypothetical protein
MDLPIFYSRMGRRQEGMCAALNYVYSCPGSLDIADYLWEQPKLAIIIVYE